MSTLHRFVSVYVPSTRHAVPITPAEHNKAVRDVGTEFSKAFGGYTAIDGIGGWLSPDYGLIQEPVTIVKSFYPETLGDNALRIARKIARKIKRKFQQEAVTVETESGIEFI